MASSHWVCSSILFPFHVADGNPGPANIPQLDHFQTCRQNLDYLKKSLSKLDLDSATKLTVLKIKLLWPFKATETKELVDRMARNKRDLADALTADGL